MFRLTVVAAMLMGSVPAFAGVTSYGLFKGKDQIQTGPGTLVDESGGDSYSVYAFIATAGEDELTLGQASIPGKLVPIFFSPEDDPTVASVDQSYPSKAALDADIPNGAVNFQIIGSDFNNLSASLSVDGDSYPTASPIGNYAATQSIDLAHLHRAMDGTGRNDRQRLFRLQPG